MLLKMNFYFPVQNGNKALKNAQRSADDQKKRICSQVRKTDESVSEAFISRNKPDDRAVFSSLSFLLHTIAEQLQK